MTHRDHMIVHAMRRVWQRWGIALTHVDYAAICADVAARSTEAIPTGHHNRVFVRVRFRGAAMVAVWDTEHGCICTFVPQMHKPAGPVARRLAA